MSRALEDDILSCLASLLFSSMLIFLFFGTSLVLLLDGGDRVEAVDGDGPTADGPLVDGPTTAAGPRLLVVSSIPDGQTAGWVWPSYSTHCGRPAGWVWTVYSPHWGWAWAAC